MSTLPTTLKQAHEIITLLRSEAGAISDTLHNLKHECAQMLSDKDKAMMEKCKRCTRGMPR